MSQASEQLVVNIVSDLEITMTRVFDAPRELVFEAHSTCEHVSKWWARGNPMDCELDFRPGGKYRFVEHAPDGNDYAFRGEFQEIQAPERIVNTFEFEGAPGNIVVDDHSFTEQNGKTTLTTTSRFESKEVRDWMLESGMEDGANQSMDKLAELLASWK